MPQKNLGLLLAGILLTLVGVEWLIGQEILSGNIERVVRGLLAACSGVCLLMNK